MSDEVDLKAMFNKLYAKNLKDATPIEPDFVKQALLLTEYLNTSLDGEVEFEIDSSGSNSSMLYLLAKGKDEVAVLSLGYETDRKGTGLTIDMGDEPFDVNDSETLHAVAQDVINSVAGKLADKANKKNQVTTFQSSMKSLIPANRWN